MVPYLFTAVSYSLRSRHNSRDVPMCHSFVAILRTFHNSPKRQRFFELVLDAYISEPHVSFVRPDGSRGMTVWKGFTISMVI